MDVISLIISIVSLLGSAISFIITFFQTRKLNSLNLQARYFEKIFDEYLITKTPQARNYIKYKNDDKLGDASKLISTMDKIKKDALYFKYSNSEFYNELTCEIDELTDFLTSCSNNRQSDIDKQADNIKEIGKK